MRPLIWLLEDQLSPAATILTEAPDAPVLLVESARTFAMLPYHKRRIAFMAAAGRHFAAELHAAGREVHHHPLKPRGYKDSLAALGDAVKKTGAKEIWLLRPSEWHTQAWLERIRGELPAELVFFDNNLFLTDRDDFKSWATSRKTPLMEFFYRGIRKRLDVLMEPDGTPTGGAWNFDKENRKPAPADLTPPPPVRFEPDAVTTAALKEIARRFPDNPGTLDDFALPVTRRHANAALQDFLDNRLDLFGDYEDAMLQRQPLLYHSHLAMLLNVGLLDPLACVRAAEERYKAGKARLNSVEGFVRQIIGWREYVYGIYWAFMPEYLTRNTRNATGGVPEFLWSGETQMNCLHQTVKQLKASAYAHHIQRLMVLANFATMAGIEPQAMNDWFLSMFIDSHDWVMAPNVIGMGMNADHGTMATKPYVASANYINRMSDYCDSCRYNPKARTGEEACPFNFLYWGFLHDNRAQLGKNPRMNMILRNLDRMNDLPTLLAQRDNFVKLNVPKNPPRRASPAAGC